MGFFFGFFCGAAAGTYYWNKELVERVYDNYFKSYFNKNFKVWEQTYNSPNEKTYQLENEDYKIVFNIIQKHPPKSGGDEPKKN